MQDVTNAAVAVVRADFAARHPDALVVGIPAAELQRRWVQNYAALGFVDVAHGCSSLLTIANTRTGDEFSRADPTATFPAAAVLPLLNARSLHAVFTRRPHWDDLDISCPQPPGRRVR